MICASCGTENRARKPLLRQLRCPALASSCPTLRRAQPRRRALLRQLRLGSRRRCAPAAPTAAAAAAARPGLRRGDRRAAPRHRPVRGPCRVHGAGRGPRRRDGPGAPVSEYFEVASRGLSERYGKTIEKFIGDAVMAVWGAPVAREDDAERAVRAGFGPRRRRPDPGRGRDPGPCGRAHRRGGLVSRGATNQGRSRATSSTPRRASSRLGRPRVPSSWASRPSARRRSGHRLRGGRAPVAQGQAESPIPSWRALPPGRRGARRAWSGRSCSRRRS